MVINSRKLNGFVNKLSIRKHLTYNLKDFTIENFTVKNRGAGNWDMVLEVEIDKFVEFLVVPTKDEGFATMRDDAPEYSEALAKKIASIIDFYSAKLKA